MLRATAMCRRFPLVRRGRAICTSSAVMRPAFSPVLRFRICAPHTLTSRWAGTRGAFQQRIKPSAGAAQSGGKMTAGTVGRSFVGLAGIGGIGMLCYYGAGLGGQGTVDYADLWPQYVRDRIRGTFMYFGGGLALTAASATLIFRSGVAHRMLTMSPMVGLAVTMGSTIGSMLLCMATDYSNTGLKHASWVLFNGCMGLSLAPMAFLGGPLLLRAAAYTGVVVGGLTAIAACAPNEEFLHMSGPLSIGLGLVVISSLGPMFLPAGGAAATVMHSISLYGGTVLFGAFVLYDTQKIILHAEQDERISFDPINESIGIYMDSINLFVRIATMLSGGKKK